MQRLITRDIPAKVSFVAACRNARENSDRQNARIEHDQAPERALSDGLRDDMKVYKQYKDDKEGFGRWLANKVFEPTYHQPHSPDQSTGLPALTSQLPSVNSASCVVVAWPCQRCGVQYRRPWLEG